MTTLSEPGSTTTSTTAVPTKAATTKAARAASATAPSAIPAQDRGSDEPFRVEVDHPEPGVVLLRASGPLDLVAEPRFAEPLREHLAAPAELVVLDLSAVDHLDTVAAVTMLEATHRARRAGAELRLVSSPAVDELLAQLDLTRFFTCARSLHEAVAELRGEPARAE